MTDDEMLDRYEKTGELSSTLFAFTLPIEPPDGASCRYVQLVARIREDFDEINEAVRAAEIAVWFGRPDLATKEEIERSREGFLPTADDLTGESYGLTPGEDAVQAYYAAAKTRGHSLEDGEFKALLWGAAGRVMLTLQNSAKVGGANLTLVFDETAKYPRGGMQSLIGTKQECLDLLRKLVENRHKFSPDSDVHPFGA